MTTASTRFANGFNPFTGQKVTNSPMTPSRKTPKTNSLPVDIDSLCICDDPFPAHRSRTDGKYTALLSKLKPGQSIKCQRADVDRIANAIKKHIAQHHPACMVRTMRNYGDGMGRVWMLPMTDKRKPKK